jgi:hypothetical protein
MQPVSVNSPAGILPAGIKRLSKQFGRDEQDHKKEIVKEIISAPFHFPKICGHRVYKIEEAELVGQKIIETKQRGVEPGFVARKTWTGKDTEKMLNDKAHKFHKEACKYRPTDGE